MKILKKVIYIVVIALVSLMIYSTSVKATTTLKVTADTLNLRKEASTSSNILTLLSKGETCELIEEDGDWYKVKYKTYTGYVTKEYVKAETSTSQNINKDNSNKIVDENKNYENNSLVEKNDTTSISEESDVLVTGKIAKETSLKLVPLIYSSEMGILNKNEEITIISELNGWSYIQTSTVAGWVRSDSIKYKQTTSDNSSTVNVDDTADNSNGKIVNETDTKNTTDDSKNQKANNNTTNTTTSDSYEAKVMYVNDSYVNVRKAPNTSSEIVMVLALNTKLTVIGESGEWYKVNTSEGIAYISKELLSSKQVTTSRGGTKKIVNKSSGNIANTSTSTKGQEIVTYANKFLGVPYVYGGESKTGFDCSGFTMYVYKKFGISMSHSAQAQSKLGKAVNANKNSASSLKQNLQAGDLVFFLDYETMSEIGHCGIYVGDGKFIHASSGSGYCVKINSLLPGEYYNTRYCEARRLI